MQKRERATRTNPKVRKQLILETAILLSEKIGHLNVTQPNVARECKISPALVQKYFISIDHLRKEIYQNAIKNENVRILSHCLTLTKMPDLLKKKTLKYLSQH